MENKLIVQGNGTQVFQFDGAKVRVVVKDGEPWFVAKDVAEVLGYSDTNYALRTHCKNPTLIVCGESPHTTGRGGFRAGTQINIIPERDVYRLIMRSKLPSAERFEEWVVAEVLPTIRKHGVYMTPEKIRETLFNPDYVIQLATVLKEEQERRMALEAKVIEDEPKVIYHDAVQALDDTMSIAYLSAFLTQQGIDIGEKRLFAWLRENGYLCKGEDKASYKNKPTQRALDEGLFKFQQNVYTDYSGTHVKYKPLVTTKGQKHILAKFHRM